MKDIQDLKIIIAEDARVIRKMAVKILKEIGYTRIIEAVDGEDAMRCLRENEDIDLVISDWNMPKKDGYDLLVWMRSNDKYKTIPFIMATAQSEKKQVAKAIDAGANSFITKPFSPPELKQIIVETFTKDSSDTIEYSKERIPHRSASGKVILHVAHIQITDHLCLGVLKHLINTGNLQPKHFELETRCMPSWNPVQQSLENGDIDAAFVLDPIAMDLYSFGVPIKLVLFAHKDGSICIRKHQNDVRLSSLDDLQSFYRHRTFYIPHLLSIHHMLASMFVKQIGLTPGLAGQPNVDVYFEVVPPVKMPEFMAQNPEVTGYLVAEPLGTKAIVAGTGKQMFLSSEIWQSHPCCVVAMRGELIHDYGDAVEEFTKMLVQAGQFITQFPNIAAEIAIPFLDPNKILGLKAPVIEKVLREPKGIKTDDLFPVVEDLDRIQQYMATEMNIGSLIDLYDFVDERFAKIACSNQQSVPSVIKDIAPILTDLFSHSDEQYTPDNHIADLQSTINLILQLTHSARSKPKPQHSLDNRLAIVHDLATTNDHLLKRSQKDQFLNENLDIVNIIRDTMFTVLNNNPTQTYSNLPIQFVAHHSYPFCSYLFDMCPVKNGYDLIMASIPGDPFQCLGLNVLIRSIFEENCRLQHEPEMMAQMLNNKIKSLPETWQQGISLTYIRIDLMRYLGITFSNQHPPIILLKNRIPMSRQIEANYNIIQGQPDLIVKPRSFKIMPGDRIFLHTESITTLSYIEQGTGAYKPLDFIGLDDLLLKHRNARIEDMVQNIWYDIHECAQKQSKNLPDVFIMGIEIAETK